MVVFGPVKVLNSSDLLIFRLVYREVLHEVRKLSPGIYSEITRITCSPGYIFNPSPCAYRLPFPTRSRWLNIKKTREMDY